MSTDEYVPNDEDFIDSWACAHVTPHDMTAEEAKDAARAFLARVRRDAAREALDGLAAAEHRATRAEAQSAIRGRAVAIYQQRASAAEAAARRAHDRAYKADIAWEDEKRRADQAEARIKAVQDVLDQAEATINHHPAYTFNGQHMDPIVNGADIRRALEG